MRLKNGAWFLFIGGTLAAALAFFAFSPGSAHALSGTAWTFLGPAPVSVSAVSDARTNLSGRVTGIAPHPANAGVIFAATAGGGVWKTADGGTTWTPLTDSQATLSMGAVAISPANPNMIYAGTGEANNRWDANYGRGILVSTDGGATWTLRRGPGGAFDRLTTARIAVDPSDPTGNTAYAAMADLGTNGLYGANTGVWKTTDGGLTWLNTTVAIDSAHPWSDIAIDPNNPSILYGALGYPFGALQNGVYKSTDGGATWTLLANAPQGYVAGRISVAVAKSNSRVIYISVAGDAVSGSTPSGTLYKFMRSDDGGATFADLTAGTPDYMGVLGYYDAALAVDPANAAIVYAGGNGANGTNGYILMSTDGGTSWSDLSAGGAPDYTSPFINQHAFAFDAGGRLLVGNDGGVFRLDDPTVPSWSDLNGNLGTVLFNGIGLHPTDPGTVIGGSRDNGTLLYSGGVVWRMTDDEPSLDAGFARFSGTDPLRVYHQSPPFSAGASFFRRSDDGGYSWITATSAISADVDSQNPFAPFVVDPADGNHLLYGTNRLWETLDGGDTWSAVSNVGQKGFNNSACPGGCNIDAIGPAPADGQTIYVATGGISAARSQIFVTTDHGGSWTERDLGVGGRVGDMQVDPVNPQIAYATVSTFNGGSGQVFRTANGGGSWINISGNLPVQPVWSLRIDPSITPNTIYIGADDGVYSSGDGGNTWGRFGAGLPNVQVFQVELNTNLRILGAATHGRGVWEIATPSQAPDLTVTKSHLGNFIQGQTGSYTITAGNGGTGATTGTVTVTDTLPAGLTATAISGSGWTCALTPLQCTRGDTLAAGSSYPSITLTVSVAGNAPASVTNTATVSGGGENNTANDTASDPTVINPAPLPDLNINKSHAGSFVQGQTGSYTITVGNGGGGVTTATVTVTDTLPAGLAAAAMGGTGWSCTLSPLQCTRGDALAAGSSYPAIILTVNVAMNAPSSVTNTATVSGGGENNTANDTASDPTVINPAPLPDLTITKSHAGNFIQGQTGTYAIVVKNSGTAATVGNVTVTDTLPAGLTAAAMGGSGWNCTLSPLRCTRSDALAAGAGYPAIALTVNVARKSPGSVTNSATVSGGGETNTGNDTASDTTSIRKK